MKQRHLYALLDTSYTTIKVVFNEIHAPAPVTKRDRQVPWSADEPKTYPGQAYTYKVPKDAGVAVDDFVVVDTKSRGLTLARVVEAHESPQIDIDAPFDYKWIVQKVDRDGYQRRVQAERVFADTMLDIERVRQRESMIRGMTENLPEGSEARRLFDQTIAQLAAPVVEGTASQGPGVTDGNR